MPSFHKVEAVLLGGSELLIEPTEHVARLLLLLRCLLSEKGRWIEVWDLGLLLWLLHAIETLRPEWCASHGSSKLLLLASKLGSTEASHHALIAWVLLLLLLEAHRVGVETSDVRHKSTCILWLLLLLVELPEVVLGLASESAALLPELIEVIFVRYQAGSCATAKLWLLALKARLVPCLQVREIEETCSICPCIILTLWLLVLLLNRGSASPGVSLELLGRGLHLLLNWGSLESVLLGLGVKAEAVEQICGLLNWLRRTHVHVCKQVGLLSWRQLLLNRSRVELAKPSP